MTIRKLILLLCMFPTIAIAQDAGLTKSGLLKPVPDSWPSLNGNYEANRFSPLKAVNDSNVQNLSLAWTSQVTGGAASVRVGGSPLLVNGVLYFTATDNGWAVDARTGRVLWHYYRQSKGDEPVTANKGFGMWGNYLYMITRDNFLVSLDARTGVERWVKPVSDPKQFYFSTMAPIVIGNHVLIGTGGDSLDLAGFLQARDPETGEIQWTTYSVPRKGEPGFETWPDEYGSLHGGGGPWVQGAYDSETNLYIYGTANPNPVFGGASRKGDDLYTSTMMAVNADTGKIAWHYQVSPHDTHDWDASVSCILIDGTIAGKPRKLVAQASRNGLFVVLDRVTGEPVVHVPFIDTITWLKGFDSKGQPIADPAMEPTVGGTLVWPSSGSATNWPPSAYSPQTGLFYVSSDEGYGLFYLSDTDDHPQGWAGIQSRLSPPGPSSIKAFDYKTGKIVWRHNWPNHGAFVGLLSTAGNLLFASNGNDLVAFNAARGNILWHAGLIDSPNAPITYMLDGKQYVFTIAGSTLYAFVMNEAESKAAKH